MSASMVIVLHKGLHNVCEKFENKSFEPSVQETIKLLLQGLTNRFFNLEMSNTLTMAIFLDPKFKHNALLKTVGEQTKTRLVNAVA